MRRNSRRYISPPRKRRGRKLGFHAHNNQNLAFANTIETMSYGVSYLDATAQGMGRGAGNCPMELLLGFLKNPKYNLYNLLLFIENYMLPLKEQGFPGGMISNICLRAN
ncbi:MAG: hypothetical protein ACLR23_06550 [Clostridia bacterium]